ncbi:hypothetical protein Q3G72_031242 [Acer saccharum]|nr:hypothetical protein Q3G72_031242 [Acer saccharum]
MTVNVLHLIKLSGLSTPIFISHQKRLRTNNSSDCYSENLVSLIILPFHRKWYIDGSVESDDDLIRTLNSRGLEKAPCSIGILIDRGNVRRPMPVDESSDQPSYRVAMIFLGGSDDREALTFAKRMAQDSRIVLTVAHFRDGDNSPAGTCEDWDRMRDSIVLREGKTNGYINYMEKEVADGHETAMTIHSMVNDFDMIIVGRRNNVESQQTTGLKQWSEFPELGVLGDLLASIDYAGRCSVLVVQQQETVIASQRLY